MEYNNKNEIVFYKGNEVYIFRYTSGDEEELLGELMNMAEKGSKTEGGFDWDDAAVISRGLIPSLFKQADEILERGLPSILQ